MTILKELSSLADRMEGKTIAILRGADLDILKSEHVEMLVTAVRAFTGEKKEARDYSVTDPDMGFPDQGGVK